MVGRHFFGVVFSDSVLHASVLFLLSVCVCAPSCFLLSSCALVSTRVDGVQGAGKISARSIWPSVL